MRGAVHCSTGYVTLPDGLIQGSTVLTVEAWFRTTASGVIFGYQNGDYPSPGNSYLPTLYVGTDGLLRGEFLNRSPNPITSASAVNDGHSHYVVLVADSNVQYLYLDGSLVGTVNGNIDQFDGMANRIGAATPPGGLPATAGHLPSTARSMTWRSTTPHFRWPRSRTTMNTNTTAR